MFFKTWCEVLPLWYPGPHRICIPKKRPWRGGVTASLLSGQRVNETLSVTEVWLDGNWHKVLVDTGTSWHVAHISCCNKWRKEDVAILTISSEEQKWEGTGVLCL
ncbi:hypothetical protein E2C01_090065 [Portunus trituberculatus]|uniref:Uncharacterized protein n=1 Tax=Portunus trituberculatus TaxID=210409 RepID=A0A5B7JKX4_PORTR|nr:hypothetical protein [Portunus trituberculatus]